jgi:hypothetical protein
MAGESRTEASDPTPDPTLSCLDDLLLALGGGSSHDWLRGMMVESDLPGSNHDAAPYVSFGQVTDSCIDG